MLVLSSVLVDIVKKYVSDKNESVCLCASHHGTVGTVLKTERTYGFKSEEDVFKVVVREAVDALNKAGYNVEQTGIDEHEQDFNRAYYSKYKVVISNHFDYERGARATLYTNEALGKKLNTIRNTVSPIKESTLRARPDLQMTSMNNAVIFEWFKNNDQAAVDALLSQVETGQTEDQNETIGPLRETTYTIVDTYKEVGRFTCKQKSGIIGYVDAQLVTQGGSGEHLAYNEYTEYNQVYYIADKKGEGFVVVRSAESGNFFPIRNYTEPGNFGTLWGHIA